MFLRKTVPDVRKDNGANQPDNHGKERKPMSNLKKP